MPETDPSECVTFVLTQSLECPSGIGRYWPLARGLAARGYRVQVLALHPDFDALTQRRYYHEGVDIWYVGQMHVQKMGSQKQYFGLPRLLWVVISSTFKLCWAAATSPCSLFHLCKPQPMNGVLALVLLAMGRHVYLDCDDLESASNQFGAEWQRSVVRWFEDHLLRWVDGITVNTSFLLARVRRLAPKKRCVLVPNAVSSERFVPPTTEAITEIRQRYQLEEHPVIVFVGSLNLVNHPVDLLLEGFAQVVVKEVPNAILMLVGGGADLAWLQNRAIELGIEQSLRFIGRVPPDDVPAYYAAADISVDPVRNDDVAQARSPLKLYESLAVGTPVVMGDIGDRRQALDNNEDMLVPAGDVIALGERLSTLLQDDATRARLRMWSLEHREQFFWESRLDDFVRIYG